jgi:hypothetical protein
VHPDHSSSIYLIHVCPLNVLSLFIQIKRGSHHVPGSEIYRNNEVSVFELDGVASASSCLRLNDLAQTLSQRAMAWNDITKCLYYVMYKRNVEDQHSCHFVGFISKVCSVWFAVTHSLLIS